MRSSIKRVRSHIRLCYAATADDAHFNATSIWTNIVEAGVHYAGLRLNAPPQVHSQNSRTERSHEHHILSWLKLWPKAKRHSLRSFQTAVLMPMPWIETTQTVTSKVWAIVHVVDATFWVGSNYGQRPSATVCVHFKLWCSCLCHGLKQLKLWLPRYGLYSSRCWRHILSWLKLWPKAKRHSLRSFQTVVLMPMPWIETTQLWLPRYGL